MGNFKLFLYYFVWKLSLHVCMNPWMIYSCVSVPFKLDGNIKCVSTIKAKVGSIYQSCCDCVLAINKVRQKIFIKLENILKLHKYICIPIAHSQRNNLGNFTNSAQLDTNTLRTLHLHLHLLLHSCSYSHHESKHNIHFTVLEISLYHRDMWLVKVSPRGTGFSKTYLAHRWGNLSMCYDSEFYQKRFSSIPISRQLLKQEWEWNIMTQMTPCVNKIFSNFKCKLVHFIFASYTWQHSV